MTATRVFVEFNNSSSFASMSSENESCLIYGFKNSKVNGNTIALFTKCNDWHFTFYMDNGEAWTIVKVVVLKQYVIKLRPWNSCWSDASGHLNKVVAEKCKVGFSLLCTQTLNWCPPTSLQRTSYSVSTHRKWLCLNLKVLLCWAVSKTFLSVDCSKNSTTHP